MMEYNTFCERYNCQLSEEKFIDIRYTIKLAIQKLKLPNSRLNTAQYPQRPILIDIAMSTNKGCSAYCKLLAKKSTLNNKIHLRETKWHNELGLNFSINFWDNARRICSSIDFDNQLKWLQFQIVRNSLQTNVIVSHFKRNVSKNCTFCQDPNSEELVSHLFWSCPNVYIFLNDVFAFISNTCLNFSPTKEQFLFGFQKIDPYQPKNYIPLVLKKYIWLSKFRTPQLTLVGFRAHLKSYICDLKFMFQFKNVPEKFNEWNTIFDAL